MVKANILEQGLATVDLNKPSPPTPPNPMDRRALKAGRWIATNLDTGETEVVVRLSLLEARRRRDKFVKRHLKLCEEVYRIEHRHKGHLTAKGRKLVEKARKQLNYSRKTSGCDVFWGLMCTLFDMVEPTPVKGCECGYCKNIRGRHKH